MTLVHRERSPRADPEGLFVLLHGRGADEHDLLPLFAALDPVGRLHAFAPRGPLSLPPGGAHWYVVREVGFPDPDTFRPTFERLQGWLDDLFESTGLGPERTIVGGFSQGAVMAYALALAAGRPRVAGVLAFSGFIPTVDGLEIDEGLAFGLPVAIGHGTYDPVITVDFGRAARDRLIAMGAEVVYRESPMPHAIDPRSVSELATWVGERIDALAPRGA